MRARRCRNCGALKAVKPLTAYVYCDYCATCFDYDASVEFRDRTALDSDDVDRALGAVVAGELNAAFLAGARETYARIFAWQVEVSIEVCPIAYSPRVKDLSYRRRFVDDLIVPWQVLTTFDAQARASGDSFQAALRTATRSRQLSQSAASLAHGSSPSALRCTRSLRARRPIRPAPRRVRPFDVSVRQRVDLRAALARCPLRRRSAAAAGRHRHGVRLHPRSPSRLLAVRLRSVRQAAAGPGGGEAYGLRGVRARPRGRRAPVSMSPVRRPAGRRHGRRVLRMQCALGAVSSGLSDATASRARSTGAAP